MPLLSVVWNPCASRPVSRPLPQVTSVSGSDKLIREASRIAGVIGVGLALGALVAGLDAPATLMALLFYAIVGLIVLARLRPFHPFSKFGLANTVTLARTALVCILAADFVPRPGVGLAPESVCALLQDGMSVQSDWYTVKGPF